MTPISAPWDSHLEPNQGNIRLWLDNLYSKFQPIEQARWNQSNIDTLFYAGCQEFVNRYFNYTGSSSIQKYYFNLIQQPINMVTGYERQHRKGYLFQSTENGDNQTTDQYTKLITNVCNLSNIFEQRSRSKELSVIAGLNLLQPYLDYSGDDPAQGEFKVKVWEYNSFITDPYWRNPDMSDCNYVWTQEYISRQEAEKRFPDHMNDIKTMTGSPQRYGRFYFLPENYNMARNDLLVVSYVYYRSKRNKKRLYSQKRNQFFDIANNQGEIDVLVQNIPDLQIVNVEVPTWKLAVVLNDSLMWSGDNPLGIDTCPFVPYFWNRDPHINYYDLQNRSLTRTMRDANFLFNYKVINNNDIAAATINAGWKRKVGAVANEDNLKKAGQGWDVIINEGFELTDVEKIIPSAVPQSDLELANQMADLIYRTSGIQLENWAGQQDKQISALTAWLKQAANLMVFQKFFDQWDYSDKLLGDVMLQILLNNWSAEKIALYIGEEPSPFFYSKVFSKYKVMVEETDLTPTQQNMQAQQMLDINMAFGREVFPPSMIIPKLNITGKGEIIPYLQQQEQQASAVQSEATNIQHAFEEARLQELYSKVANNIAMAKERYGRYESNIGLLEERMAEVSKNRALSTKAKMEALEKMVDVIAKLGDAETAMRYNDVENINNANMPREDMEKRQAHRESMNIEFMSKIMGNNNGQPMPQRQEMAQQSM